MAHSCILFSLINFRMSLLALMKSEMFMFCTQLLELITLRLLMRLIEVRFKSSGKSSLRLRSSVFSLIFDLVRR